MADWTDDAFAKATKLLFGKPLSPIEKYSAWLKSRVPGGRVEKSMISGANAYLPDYGFFRHIPTGKLACLADLEEVAGKRIIAAEGICSLSDLLSQLDAFAYFIPTYEAGRNAGVENTAGPMDCVNIRDSFDPFTSKNCAFAFSIMDSECLFGAYRVVKSSFSIHAYNCLSLQRCFEMDSCKNCNDSHFCHNAENMDNCMFCFNTKNKRYAIGNMELGRERYLEAKGKILGEIAKRLEKDGKLGFDIYNVLSRNR